MSRDKPQAQTPQKHPEPYQHDLNPHAMAGQNIGLGETKPSRDAPTAYDVKPVHRRFHEFTDDELKQIHILPPGSRLEQGATYLDLTNLDMGEFTATGEMRADPNSWIVAKKTVPYPLWNRLLGVETPERVEQGRECKRKVVISRLCGGPGEVVVANEVLDGTDMLGQLLGEGYADARSLLSCSPHFFRRLRREPHLGAVRGGVA